jgi:hypothetical protein
MRATRMSGLREKGVGDQGGGGNSFRVPDRADTDADDHFVQQYGFILTAQLLTRNA